MAATGACFAQAAASFSPAFVRCASSTSSFSSPSSSGNKPHATPNNKSRRRFKAVASERTLTEMAATRASFPNGIQKTTQRQKEDEEAAAAEVHRNEKGQEHISNINVDNNPYVLALEGVETESKTSLKDYLKQSEEFIRQPDSGPPRWFSPLECGSRLHNSPLLLFLPGIIDMGLGLAMQHHALGKIFDIWCLHIPVKDRTSFRGVVQLVERTVRSEYYRSPKRPIYLVGESLGACFALSVAARNPDIDLVLILANPATSFDRLPMQPLLTPLLEFIPDQLHLGLTNLLSFVTGDSLRTATEDVVKRLIPQQTASGLQDDVAAMTSYLSILGNIFTRETVLWKLEMLKSASAYANARLQSIKAQALVLSSGRDQLLQSEEEGQRLHRVIPKCEIRVFKDSGHRIFLEDDINLATIIKGTSFYRRGRIHDYVSDYVPVTPPEFKKMHESVKSFLQMTSPVMLSTLQDGKIVKGLAGIPSEGPVLFVGYHMLFGSDLIPMIAIPLLEKNILVRGIAHPLMFMRAKEGLLPPLPAFDMCRVMGAVPVSGANFYKLMSSKSHALLYPGGMREAFHRKGEEYVLHWPEEAEFIRMAARFGAKIVPFGTVGEDDMLEILLDYNDQMNIPMFREYIKSMTEESINVRTERTGEVAKQDVHYPIVLPKLPGRFYYCFGKPIETEGRKQELRDKEKARELYLQVHSEVENCMAFLKKKRESDPYRNILARVAYRATHGPNSQVPTFEL